MNFKNLKEALEGNIISLKDGEVKLDYLSYNSNDLKDNTLFICKGENFKEEYLLNAVKTGKVSAYVTDKDIELDIPHIKVKDIRTVLPIISKSFYDNVCDKITKIGITGTKGKTTTTYFLKNIISEYLNKECPYLSTVDMYTGITKKESTLTTPEAMDLHKYFSEVYKSSLPYIVMEVASQGYKAKRLDGITFDYGAFLNIDLDHISEVEHENYLDYLNCKLEFMKNVKHAFVNTETNNYSDVIKSVNGDITTFGKKGDYHLVKEKSDKTGNIFTIKGPDILEEFETSMLGKVNIDNALAAVTIAKKLGIDNESIKKGLLNTTVPGRMNVFNKEGITIIVDYAHNRLSFTELYKFIKENYNGRIISVGGAPGGKAYERRKDFADVVGTMSDYIYITSEDPWKENATDICEELSKDIPEYKHEIIIDRESAVNKALNEATENDVIVLLAKGAETYQKVGEKIIPYPSDYTLAKKFVRTRKK